MKHDKIIIAPDSFKGTLTSVQVADIIAEEVSAAFPGCTITKIPIADGGEGSVDIILAATGGNRYETEVLSPDDRQIRAAFGITANGTAIIEMAQSSGITKQNGLHPMTASTYGFGQLIQSALELGAKDFILCIGGSATTDGGCGMAAALGVQFYDSAGVSFIPSGGTLSYIARIDVAGIDKRILNCDIIVMCDVDNPLFGANGAAHVYGPQKGASPEQVLVLDEGLRHLGGVFIEHFGVDYSINPGAGAAGGLGAGCIAFLGASLVSGIDTILKLCGFDKHIMNADLVITGEGKLDSQSFSGKVLSGILQSAGLVPVWSICGICECGEEVLRRQNLTVFQTSEGMSIDESINDPEMSLRAAARKAMQYVNGLKTEMKNET